MQKTQKEALIFNCRLAISEVNDPRTRGIVAAHLVLN